MGTTYINKFNTVIPKGITHGYVADDIYYPYNNSYITTIRIPKNGGLSDISTLHQRVKITKK